MRVLVFISLYCCYGFIPKIVYSKINILRIPNNELTIIEPSFSFINKSTQNETDEGVSVTLPKDPPKFPTLTLSNIAFLLIEQ